MQQRRFRPGDVLDDYCPRERRLTDHAIVAMIDDHIKQTRCVVCDAEHEYKDGKVPPQRRKKAPAGLFAQVLDGLQGPQPAARVSTQVEPDGADTDEILDGADSVDATSQPDMAAHLSAGGHDAEALAAVVAAGAPVTLKDTLKDIVPDSDTVADADNDADPEADPEADNGPASGREEGLWRRALIRAALPRPEGQPPPQTRPAPDFTVRQPTDNRVQRHGRRRSPGGQSDQGGGTPHGPMRSGRGSHGHGQGPGSGQGSGQGQGAGRSRRRRGGKKNH